jgi:hypothetical protein
MGPSVVFFSLLLRRGMVVVAAWAVTADANVAKTARRSRLGGARCFAPITKSVTVG